MAETKIAPKPFEQYTKGEQDLIVEQTKRLLVLWGTHQIEYGTGPSEQEGTSDSVFLWLAMDKGWVAKDGTRVLSKGFKVAAAFLRR